MTSDLSLPTWFMPHSAPIKVCVTGAAGQIGYALLPLIANGSMLGSAQPVALRLLDLPHASRALQGIAMELEDSVYPLLTEVVVTSDVRTAFQDVEVAVLVGAFPRGKGMERRDLLARNAAIFKEQGAVLNEVAHPNVKVVVVGNPANTNALIAQRHAPRIPARNFSALTRLDHNRACGQLAKQLGVTPDLVKNVVIWGNHSNTQVPDVTYAVVNRGVEDVPVPSLVSEAWVTDALLPCVRGRGGAIIEARGMSSAASAARAAAQHVHDWLLGTPAGEHVSMAVVSDGSYGVPEGIVFSFPVRSKNGEWRIVQGLPISDKVRTLMQESATELEEERDTAEATLRDAKL